jgi:hypothetical protein
LQLSSSLLKHWPWLIGIAALTAVYGFLHILYERGAQRIIFDAFCRQDFSYRLNVTIEFDGKPYSSKVIGAVSHPRVQTGGTCGDPVGSILPFRTEDNRLVLLYAGICDKAADSFADGERGDRANVNLANAMRQHRRLNLAPLCIGLVRNRPDNVGDRGYDGFVIDDADNPQHWRGFNFDHGPNFDSTSEANLRVVSAIAEAANLSTENGLEKIAPAILKTKFVYKDWSESPEPMFFSRRRHQEVLDYTATEQRP